MGKGTDQVLRDLVGLQERIYRLFDEHTGRSQGNPENVSSQWAPPVDIYETPDSFVLLAEIPGLDQDEIGLEISNDLLSLRGERPVNTSDPQFSYHRLERPNGLFQRVFRLPSNVDPSAAKAGYRDGVLEVTLPKCRSAVAHSVDVEVQD